MVSPLQASPACIPAEIERLVVRAAREIQLLAALTPVHAHRERARLVAELRARRRPLPDWEYVPVRHDDLRGALDAAAKMLATRADPVADLYVARLRELELEAALCTAGGSADLDRLARTRFATKDPSIARAASDLCAAWLQQPPLAPVDEPIASDDPSPKSLLSLMREGVGRLRLPFAVVVEPSLAPLAATGDRVILVTAGRPVGEEDSLRTVLHELEGHARPRARAKACGWPLLRAGTAAGVDDQEGRALLLEERAGRLGVRRKRQLAARHWAVDAMLEGASFPDVAGMLVEAHGVDPEEAVVIAERAFRGGDGLRPGLGREGVYLQAFVRVRRHLAAHPEDDEVMASGQVAVDACEAVRRFI